jgi:hypothetical protein
VNWIAADIVRVQDGLLIEQSSLGKGLAAASIGCLLWKEVRRIALLALGRRVGWLFSLCRPIPLRLGQARASRSCSKARSSRRRWSGTSAARHFCSPLRL